MASGRPASAPWLGSGVLHEVASEKEHKEGVLADSSADHLPPGKAVGVPKFSDTETKMPEPQLELKRRLSSIESSADSTFSGPTTSAKSSISSYSQAGSTTNIATSVMDSAQMARLRVRDDDASSPKRQLGALRSPAPPQNSRLLSKADFRQWPAPVYSQQTSSPPQQPPPSKSSAMPERCQQHGESSPMSKSRMPHMTFPLENAVGWSNLSRQSTSAPSSRRNSLQVGLGDETVGIVSQEAPQESMAMEPSDTVDNPLQNVFELCIRNCNQSSHVREGFSVDATNDLRLGPTAAQDFSLEERRMQLKALSSEVFPAPSTPASSNCAGSPPSSSSSQELTEEICDVILQRVFKTSLENLSLAGEIWESVHQCLEEVANFVDEDKFCSMGREGPSVYASLPNRQFPLNHHEGTGFAPGVPKGGDNNDAGGTHGLKQGQKHGRDSDGNQNGDEAEEGDSDGDDGTGRGKKKRKTKTPLSVGLFSCPFRKRNPLRFNIRHHNQCAIKGFDSFVALKKHVTSFHRRRAFGIVCYRCKADFPTKEELTAHSEVPKDLICQTRSSLEDSDYDPEDGISLTAADKLIERKNAGKVDNWKGLWQTLFPGDRDDEIKSPEFEPPVELEEVKHEYKVSFTQLHTQFRALAATLPMPPAQQLDIASRMATTANGHFCSAIDAAKTRCRGSAGLMARRPRGVSQRTNRPSQHLLADTTFRAAQDVSGPRSIVKAPWPRGEAGQHPTSQSQHIGQLASHGGSLSSSVDTNSGSSLSFVEVGQQSDLLHPNQQSRSHHELPSSAPPAHATLLSPPSANAYHTLTAAQVGGSIGQDHAQQQQHYHFSDPHEMLHTNAATSQHLNPAVLDNNFTVSNGAGPYLNLEQQFGFSGIQSYSAGPMPGLSSSSGSGSSGLDRLAGAAPGGAGLTPSGYSEVTHGQCSLPTGMGDVDGSAGGGVSVGYRDSYVDGDDYLWPNLGNDFGER